MAKRPAGGFPLDNAFESLRKVVVQTQDALTRFVSALQRAVGGSGGTSPGTAAGISAVGDAANRATKGIDALTAAQVKSTHAAVRWRLHLKGAQDAVNGLKAAGEVAKRLGFAEASDGIQRFAEGLELVKGLVAGVVAGFRPLLGAGLILGAVAAGVGLIQEAIAATTGEMLGLGDTIAAVALGLGMAFEKSIAGWKLLLVEFAAFVRPIFATIGEVMLRPVADALIALSESMRHMGLDLQTSTNPAIRAAGKAMQEIASGAEAAGLALDGAIDSLSSGARRAPEEAARAQAQILSDLESTLEGYRVQINKTFDEGAGESLFRNPQRALDEFIAYLRQKSPEVFDLLEKFFRPDRAATATTPRASGLQAGAEWSSGVEDALAQSRIDETLLNALVVDPKDETKVVNSFRDLWKNVKRVFSESPLGFVGAFLGVGGGPGMGRPQGFADGGLVGAPGAGSAPFPRPAGISPRDTVAAWLEPGELVIPRWLTHVFLPLFEAARQMRFPSLAALAGGLPAIPSLAMTSGPRGYAGGGLVAPSSGGGSRAPSVLPVLVTDAQGMEPLAAGIEPEILRRIAGNPSAYREALGL